MPDVHAILGPSSAYRWLACTPSGRLNAVKPSKAGSWAQEGTDAHELCEYKLKTRYTDSHPHDPRGNLDYYDESMESYTDDYADFVGERLSKHKNPTLLVEERVDFSEYVSGGFGTADCIIVSDSCLEVVDFKYGLGVLVDANDNPQMKLYALGAYISLSELYSFDQVRMTIFQPRRENISTFTINVKDLLRWAKDYVKPRAKLAYEGGGDFCAGEHCIFCSVKSTCRARAEYCLELEKWSDTSADLLTPDEISYILPRVEVIKEWAEDLKKEVQEMILSGAEVKGYKVVESRTNRKFTDEGKVAERLIGEGFDPYKAPELLGMTAIQSLVGGKKKFDALLNGYIYKPKGKPTLVKDTDRRPPYTTLEDEDFGDLLD